MLLYIKCTFRGIFPCGNKLYLFTKRRKFDSADDTVKYG